MVGAALGQTLPSTLRTPEDEGRRICIELGYYGLHGGNWARQQFAVVPGKSPHWLEGHHLLFAEAPSLKSEHQILG